ncbi:hydroxymethylbilane synthase [Cylindrospermopsis raciborskii S07]|uniref:Porphobilinogen deaminase n=2 Tax=Cylindrospermopsis raciborskii TaxID=77022 RepID=A0A853MEL2_9CYAN|nr:hydroxymethylbilane synthase [Cylindrospermopsis raciborskii]EFA68847.1 Porphobilinogen deaminase [Cylindrospermopsis raciborskii CS-505]OBU77811.1 hydroxymethylbilane synthase [Cylindrospermopsis raciborskii CS-505]OHY33096.1 hydroxymethylbilane synthase [Cylindrospermopsis raciborskii CS-508]PNJ91586.1 hydroxymethylbilane synthase [Cylindrospermopsis raciborskii C04]PNJ91994.1 hydroxymethylbilane synthase [Cylindrospermopsis raciborskii C07]
MTSVSSPSRIIRIGSRKSELALVQTYWVQEQLQKSYPDIDFQVHTMSTQGDKILDVALAKIGDKGLFTKELELGMINQEIDFAVHSLKDLPTNLPEGLTLAAITERENPADAVVFHQNHLGQTLATLPPGSVIGTSSLRRLAQLRHKFPHFTFKDVRGNLNTRMTKLDAGEYDALILAVAGLERLNMHHRIHEILPPDISLHAVGQGALGIECRENDLELITILKAIEHPQTRDRCLAERSFLRSLEGGCQVPIGVNTEIDGETLTLTGIVASVNGENLVKNTITGAATDAEKLGTQLANILREQGATEILEEIFTQIQRGS